MQATAIYYKPKVVKLTGKRIESERMLRLCIATKSTTATLPEAYTKLATAAEESAALTEIAKYGSEYYAYGSGTYKWYLKQYIDFSPYLSIHY